MRAGLLMRQTHHWASLVFVGAIVLHLRRSSAKAQRTWAKAHDPAVETYGEGRRAHQTAFAALKHSVEKVGDHWEPKPRQGPSDEQARRGAGQPDMPTAGGVNANASKHRLYEVAQRLDVAGRSSMTKAKLIAAIERVPAPDSAGWRSSLSGSCPLTAVPMS